MYPCAYYFGIEAYQGHMRRFSKVEDLGILSFGLSVFGYFNSGQ